MYAHNFKSFQLTAQLNNHNIIVVLLQLQLLFFVFKGLIITIRSWVDFSVYFIK